MRGLARTVLAGLTVIIAICWTVSTGAAAAQRRPAMQFPSGVTLDSAGNVFVADRAAHVVFRIDARTNDITVFAGTGNAGRSGDGGPAAAAMTNPFGFTFDRAGNLFFFDTEVHAIRRIDARAGVVTTVVGNKQQGFSGDGGPGTQAMLYRPHSGTFDRDGALVFGDSFNNRIRRWDPSTGIIETIAGTGERGSSPDGTPARTMNFTFFGGIAVDRAGDLVITGRDHRSLKFDRRAGVIRVIAGTGVAGFSGDGGPARAAQISAPYGIVIAPNGDIIFADAGNARVRRIDAATGVIRTIAGREAPRTRADSTSRNSETHTQASFAAHPGPRNSHVMTSAGQLGVYMFGGAGSADPRLVDTLWRWTGTEWHPLSNMGPHSRNLTGAAFDRRRGALVVYGGSGIGSGTRFGDTWEWGARHWQEKNVRTPGPRDHHAMTYDEARRTVVMFGGAEAGTLVSGTWTWDGERWTKADTSAAPPAVVHHAMAYDSRRQRVVMYGGIGTDNGKRSDTWEWDGTRWGRIATPSHPGPRSHHRLAYDEARGLIVMFGGGDSTATDTWTYDGSTWERRAVSGPPPRWSPAMAYDSARRRIVLFGGGRNARPYGALGDLWEWDGARWEQRQ